MPVKRAAAGPSAGQKRTRFASSPSPSSSSSARTRPANARTTSNDPDADGDAEDDDLLEEDIPQGGAKARQRAKRGLQGEEGYGSDSSNDDEGVVPSRRPGGKEEEEEDVDMFADEVEEEKEEPKSKSKEKEFMNLEDVEGQEFGRSSDVASGYGGNADGDEEDEESARQQKRMSVLDGDMGVDITPFNMKEEMDEGKFTADGESYVQNAKDPNEKHDLWLADLDEEAIRKAREAHEERERVERERQAKEENGGKEEREKQVGLMREAVGLMQRGETVLEALQRLGKEVEEEKKKRDAVERGAKKKSWAERQKERKAMMASEQEHSDPIHTSNPFTNLSNIVSGLTTIGHLDVYSLSREAIQRMLPAISASNGATVAETRSAPPPPPTDTRTFQYRFSLGYMRSLPEGQRPVEREVFGPFSVMQLRGWRSTGFFGTTPACENVELRLVKEGSEPGPWGPWGDVVG